MIKQEEENERYCDYVLSCIEECKDAVPFEAYNKNEAS